MRYARVMINLSDKRIFIVHNSHNNFLRETYIRKDLRMVSSTFYQQPTLFNTNYEPLNHEHPSLQFYFTESFSLMDKSIDPPTLLASLLGKYLSFNEMDGTYGRTIQQKSLAQNIKSKLETLPLPESLVQAFKLINESGESIKPTDDLMWLFSAYFSIFPLLNSELTNIHIKSKLTICDINNIYFHTVLERSLGRRADLKTLFANNETIELALITNQFEPVFKKLMDNLDNEERRSGILGDMHILIKHATMEQVENIILPRIIPFLHSGSPESKHMHKKRKFDADQHRISTNVLPFIINKVNNETLESKIVPEIFNLLKQQAPRVGELLLSCVNRLSVEALKRCIQPALTRCYFNESSDEIYKYNSKILAIKPLLAMISRVNNEKNDETSEQLIPDLNNHKVEEILTFLKELRSIDRYVNEKLFQAVNEMVTNYNDKFLKTLNDKTQYYSALYISHMSAQQVKSFFSAVSLVEGFKNGGESFLRALGEFASLPSDIYPAPLRKRAFDFLCNHRHDKEFIFIIINYLKTNDFSDVHSRKILSDLSHFALQKLQETGYYEDIFGVYDKLLATCASLMTEQELKVHIVPMIDSKKINDGNVNYVKVMHETFKHVFAKINDGKIHDKFFLCFLQLNLNHILTGCEDILSLIIKKHNPLWQIYACRSILRSDIPGYNLNAVANVLAIFYKHNSELLHIPGFCTAHHNGSVELSNRILGSSVSPQSKPEAENKCSMM